MRRNSEVYTNIQKSDLLFKDIIFINKAPYAGCGVVSGDRLCVVFAENNGYSCTSVDV